MCGLYGFTTNKEKSLSEDQKADRERIVKSLAITMENRGVDSSGMAFIKDNEVVILKKAVHSTRFLQQKNVKEMLATQPELILGHTRQATFGTINDKNAHPFLKGRILGAHNGVVSNQLEIDGEVEVDSELIFLLLDENKNDFKETFKHLSGSSAITWLDIKDPNTIYFVTHNNPLALVYISELKTIFWASSKRALRTVLMATVGLNKRDIWSPRENTVYKISPNLRISKHKVKFKKEVLNEGNSKVGKYPYQSGVGVPTTQATLAKGNQNLLGEDLTDKELEELEEEDMTEEELKEFEEFNEFNDGKHTEAEIIRDTVDNFGCEMCQQAINPKRGFWWSYSLHIVICSKCYIKYSGNSLDYEFFSYEGYLKLDRGEVGDSYEEVQSNRQGRGLPF